MTSATNLHEDNIGACLGQGDGHLGTDTPRGACHQRRAVFEREERCKSLHFAVTFRLVYARMKLEAVIL